MGMSRSENMSRIRGEKTSPEMVLRRALWAKGKRYRANYRTPAGRADLVFVRRRLAIFLDGCFWHGCPEHYVRPRSKTEHWSKRLRENVERDRRQTLQLESEGWTVCRLWEHEIFENLEGCVERILHLLEEDGSAPEEAWRVIQADAIAGEERLEEWHLQDLRNPEKEKVIQRIRTTKKWQQKEK